MSDPGIGAGKYMEKKPPYEFISRKDHILLYVSVFPVTVGKSDHSTRNMPFMQVEIYIIERREFRNSLYAMQ